MFDHTRFLKLSFTSLFVTLGILGCLTEMMVPTLSPSPTPTNVGPEVGQTLASTRISPAAESAILPTAAATSTTTPRPPATMTDFWNGMANWVLDIEDTGLPVGESDTVYLGDGIYWSYLHASYQSAGVYDSCGNPVEFPGCVTQWVSLDGGEHFEIASPTCLFECASCPCTSYDHPWQQQYPRVTRTSDGRWVMVYEQAAGSWISASLDGLNWTHPEPIHGTGIWEYAPPNATEFMRIGPQPFEQLDWTYMAGGPPGIAVEGNDIYVFVGLGQSPGHLGCFRTKLDDLANFAPCASNPLLTGALEYGPVELTHEAANAFYDHRFITSADILFVDDYYYMSYEGTRGRSSPELDREDQFSLAFARSPVLDGQWEKFSGNPMLYGLVDNWGLGHADLLIVDGRTIMYTGIPGLLRGRFILEHTDN